MKGVTLILHGHKHMPHIVTKDIATPFGSQIITVVGCGSTTGADQKPMCYDVLAFEPSSGRATVTFFQDDLGDGAGFRQAGVSFLSTRNEQIRQ
jgi:hypothetical protein